MRAGVCFSFLLLLLAFSLQPSYVSMRTYVLLQALVDYVHSKGLKFGLYSDAGDKTCEGRPGVRVFVVFVFVLLLLAVELGFYVDLVLNRRFPRF